MLWGLRGADGNLNKDRGIYNKNKSNPVAQPWTFNREK